MRTGGRSSGSGRGARGSFVSLAVLLMAIGAGVGVCALPVGERHLLWLSYAGIGLVGVLFVWTFADMRREDARAAAGQCRACGYDLRATPERCPECGARFGRRRRRARGDQEV